MSAAAYLGGIRLYVDSVGFFITLAALAIVCWCIVALVRWRFRRAAILAAAGLVALIASAAQIWVADAEVLVEVAAAYDSAPPARRIEMAADLKQHWLWSDTLRMSSWVAMADRWGVCHRHWTQANCVRPEGERLPLGYAGDHLAKVIHDGI